MRDSSVVIEVFPNSQGKLTVSRVIKWFRDKDGNLQYQYNTTKRVADFKNEPKQLQKFFTALGVGSVFYNKATGEYNKYL
jgi:hypothetical protein